MRQVLWPVAILLCVACSPSAPGLPRTVEPGSDSDPGGVLLHHPEFDRPILCSFVSIESRGYVDYELGFYRESDRGYELIDTTMRIGGYTQPECTELAAVGLPGVLTTVSATGDEAYFFIRDGRLVSEVENPEEWEVIKP